MKLETKNLRKFAEIVTRAAVAASMICLSIGICTPSFANISESDRSLASIPDRVRTLDLTSVIVMPVQSKSFLSADLFRQYCPANLTPTTDQAAFARQFSDGISQKITDSVANTFLRQDPMIKRWSEKIDKVSQQALVIGGGDGSSSAIPQKISFQVKASERQAYLTYEGYIKTDVIYQIGPNQVVFSMSKSLAKDTAIAFQNVSPVGQIDRSGNLSFVWNF